MVSRFIRGVCTVVTACELAMEALTKGRPHHLDRCGFTEDAEPDEIVCCPTTAVRLTPTPPTTNTAFKKGKFIVCRGKL